MAWKDIASTEIKYKDKAGTSPSGITAVCLQYLEGSESATEVTVRFKYYHTDGKSTNLWDSMYVLYNANNEGASGNLGRTLFKLKAWSETTGAAWPYYSDDFVINKAYTNEFALQDLWICNNGNTAITPVTASNFYSNSRFSSGNYSCKAASQFFSITGTTATAGSAPTVSVTDLGSNEVLVSGILGRSGNYNNFMSATLYYTLDGSDPKTSSTRLSRSLGTSASATYGAYITISKACTVKAYVVCTYEYNEASATGSVAAKYYNTAGAPSKPTLAASSFRNGRLTVKQDWTWSWTPGASATYHRLRFYINDVSVPMKDTAGKVITRELTPGDFVVDSADLAYGCTMKPSILLPAGYSLKAGDNICLAIQACAVNGAGQELLSSIKYSDTYTVQNAGVLNVKVDNAWREGQVYVKVNNNWVEAESVSVKADNAWKESQ